MKKKPAKKSAAGVHLGIDIAKDKFDAVLRTAAGAQHHEVFANDAAGLKALGRWLTQHRTGPLTCVMEATGIYWEEAAAWLHARRHTVHVLNPAAARRFAESQLCRNKTDAVDAALLCRMAQIAVQCALTVWTPPAAAVLHLRALSRARCRLVAARAALRVQVQETRHRLIQQSLRTLLQAHDRQIRQLERALQAHVKAHPEIAAEIALLTSIPGIAFISATAIRSELATLHHAGVRQTVAYAGLNPRQWQSGKSVQGRSRLSKTGNARLRHTLYLPALTGWRHHPLLRAFAARLLAKGKKKMEIVGALMHKLLAHCCGVLKTRKPFDPHWLVP